jgi:Uma2 family endonuclease
VAAPIPARLATFTDLAALDEPDRVEIVHGALVQKAMPSVAHSRAQTQLIRKLGGFHRRHGRRPGGWWLLTEIHVEYQDHQVHCHDVSGWRRDRVPEMPAGWPVRIRPDWVCEIVSPTHEKRDLVDKPKVLHAAEVPYLWLVNPEEKLLLVQRWSSAGYTTILAASSGQTVRAEPFDLLEFRVGALFGEDEDDDD